MGNQSLPGRSLFQHHQHQFQNQNQLLKAKNQNQFQSQNHFQISKWIFQKLLPSETQRMPPLSLSETLKEPTLVNIKSKSKFKISSPPLSLMLQLLTFHLSQESQPLLKSLETVISLATLLKREIRDLVQNLNGTLFTTKSDTNNVTLMSLSLVTNTNSESRLSMKSVSPMVLPPRNSLIFQRKPPLMSNQSTQR